MKRVYLDNGSTSFPKAPGVSDAVKFFMDEVGANVNRGGYETAYSAEDVIMETRVMLKNLFNCPYKTRNVIFTPNITHSLNYIIKGWLKPGDHVLVSSMEHNAMMRPIVQLGAHGVSFDRIPCTCDGEMIVEKIEELIRPETKGILTLHGSNVCGAVMPLEAVGQICKKHNIKFVVDAAQTAGVFPIDMVKMNIDILAFTGHKSLLGPQGIGGFLISDEMAKVVDPLITGGTGSFGNTVLKHFLTSDIGQIRIFSRDEKKQDDMRHEFQAKMPEVAEKIKFYIGDVRDIASVKIDRVTLVRA